MITHQEFSLSLSFAQYLFESLMEPFKNMCNNQKSNICHCQETYSKEPTTKLSTLVNLLLCWRQLLVPYYTFLGPGRQCWRWCESKKLSVRAELVQNRPGSGVACVKLHQTLSFCLLWHNITD